MSSYPLKPNDLPITGVLEDIREHLQQRDELVLQAAPGAGKTTLVPLSLLDEPWLGRQKILMLEPRRMAARTAAERMAALLGEKPGMTVGYRIRQQSRVSAHTRIEVITEGILTRMLQSDPELQGVGLVIFDEFHERNLDSDLGLALTLQARAMLREDNPLKLLLMSATLEGLDFTAVLGNVAQISSAGRMFPVELHYAAAVAAHESLEQAMARVILRALQETDGSILAFLPGQREINRLKQLLQTQIDASICVFPLYGALPLQQQLQAIRALAPGDACRRKIVLATDIAETSITIDGISTVVDSGLSRQPGFDPQTGMTRLHTRRISRASSIQRMGRAGRTRAGHCYRLWNESAQATLAQQTPAQILQADLSPLALQLLQWGVSDPAELAWLDPPPPAAFAQALDLLAELGALAWQSDGVPRLTAHGEQMARLPLHPRLAHMLLKASEQHQQHKASALAVLLSERDPLQQYAADISARVDVLLGEIPCEARHNGWRQRAQAQMQSFQKLCRAAFCAEPSQALQQHDVVGYLISLAYPDRIARRRNDNSRHYLLSNGRACTLSTEDRLPASEWLAVAELGGLAGQREDRIYSAAALNPALFDNLLAATKKTHEKIAWDEQSGKLLAERQIRVGAIVLQRERLSDISAAARKQAIAQWIAKQQLSPLQWSASARALRQRIQCLRTHQIDSGSGIEWPDVSDQGLLATLDTWLLPFLDSVRRVEDFKQLDLTQCLHSLLPWPLPQKLDALAPQKLQVPSGSHIAIDYSHSPPVLAVKLQEMFGCRETPSIANGRIQLLVHLLSPAQKPLQITQDLAGFWSGSYHAVKKEMKGRYPKHPWPDDPLQALPTRYTKHRRR